MQQFVKLTIFMEALSKELEPIDLVAKKAILENLEKQIIKLSHTNALPLDRILKELGSPKQLANRYLIEQGIPPKKTGLGIFAWFLIIFGTGLLTMVLAVLLLAWSFSPIFKVDEKNGQLVILGGLIDIKTSHHDSFHMGTHKRYKFSGNFPYEEARHKKFSLHFVSGNIEIQTKESRDILWDCESNGKHGSEIMFEDDTITFLPDGSATGLNCKLTLPTKLSLQLEGTNGKIKVDKLLSNSNIKLQTGRIELKLDSDRHYFFDAQIENGQLPQLPTSRAIDSIRSTIRMKNGTIKI